MNFTMSELLVRLYDLLINCLYSLRYFYKMMELHIIAFLKAALDCSSMINILTISLTQSIKAYDKNTSDY